MSKDYPWGKGTPVWVRDATLNDSDKSFTVPAGKVWSVIGIKARLVTTATVGQRYFRVSITDGTNEVWSVGQGNAVTASQNILFDMQPGINSLSNNEEAGTNNAYLRSIPSMILPAGYVIRVYDAGAIDAAADDLTVFLHYVEYDA